MTRSRLADLARGATAAVTLLVLVAGPPAALASAVGWPLPKSVPSLAAIEEAARSGVSDEFIINALATIAWIAWLQVAAAIVCEVIALLRRSPTTRLPVLPGLQPVVAKLAAAALLLAASTSSRIPHAAAQPATAQPGTPPAAAATLAVPEEEAPAAPARISEVVTVTVERHDSYWAIAERTLGDGFRWREIRDANVGRTMPDGHVIAHGSDLVRPGWILEVPITPRVADPLQAPMLTPTGAEITVEPGDGFWDIAEEQVEAELGHAASDEEVRPYWEALVQANHDRLADPSDPNLLFTGQRLALVGPPVAAPPQPAPVPAPIPTDPPPVETVPESTVTTPPPTTATSATPTAQHAPTVPAEQPAAGSDVPDASVAEVMAAGFSALLAVGAARNLARRRRRRAHLGLVADHPTADNDAEVHRTILLSADSTAIDTLEAGLLHLAAALRDAHIAATPLLVQHGGGHLDVYVDPPSHPPSGWTSADDTGTVWTATSLNGPPQLNGDPVCPAPLLVTLGRPDDGGQLYLDLEAASVVALTGDPAVARDVARTMVADLALSPLGDTIDIVVIGDLGRDTTQFDHVRSVRDWTGIADDLEAWAVQTHAVLEDNGWSGPFVARAIDPHHDALAPLAIIATEPPPPELLQRVAAVGRCVAGVVVAGCDVPGAMLIDCRPDRITIPSIGLEATPHPIEVASLDAIVALLDEPADDEADSFEPTLFDDASAWDVGDPDAPEPEVLVHVLGEIRVDQAPTLTAKQTAVLAFVALHGTVTAERVENAVWAAASSSRRKRLSNTASEIRAAIGREHFPTASDGRYTAGPAVSTDAHQFDLLVRRAARECPDVACTTLRAALDLVTGPVFSYRDVDRASFTWVDLENLVSTWELRIAAVAERCADLYIGTGRPTEAADVATRALTLIPTHTGITEALMRAHAANGDRLAVQRVFQAHASALEQLDLDDVAQSTSDLYDQLLQRSG